MEPIIELTETDLDQVCGGQADTAACISSTDGVCVCLE
jgi:hypothetical protein